MQIIKDLLEDPQFREQVKFCIKEYRAEEKIVQKGTMHEAFYIVNSGKVKIILKSVINAPQASILLGANESFGEYALFDNLPASADVIAETKAELIEIDIPSLRIYLEKNPTVGYKICRDFLRKLIKRLRESNKTIINFYTTEKNML